MYDLREITFFVVDDSEDMIYLHSMKLKELYQNCTVYEFSNGREAVESLSKHNPSIVVTDLQMPDGNGDYVVEHVKNYNKDIKVLLISGAPQASTKANLFDKIMPKMTSRDVFASVIQELVCEV